MISRRGASQLILSENNLTVKLFEYFLKELKEDADRLYRKERYRISMDNDSKMRPLP